MGDCEGSEIGCDKEIQENKLMLLSSISYTDEQTGKRQRKNKGALQVLPRICIQSIETHKT